MRSTAFLSLVVILECVWWHGKMYVELWKDWKCELDFGFLRLGLNFSLWKSICYLCGKGYSTKFKSLSWKFFVLQNRTTCSYKMVLLVGLGTLTLLHALILLFYGYVTMLISCKAFGYLNICNLELIWSTTFSNLILS